MQALWIPPIQFVEGEDPMSRAKLFGIGLFIGAMLGLLTFH